MDNAVALVQAYLRVNGYFTVTEFPVVEAVRRGGHRTATDIDVLAFRFPGAGRLVPREGSGAKRDRTIGAPDPALGLVHDEADMLIGEVKEGRAELNRGARDPAVLRAALTRFGCCAPEEVEALVQSLVREGRGRTQHGHQVRLAAFGSITEEPHPRYHPIELGRVIEFTAEFLRDNWDALRVTELKDPSLGLLAAVIKSGARLGSRESLGPGIRTHARDHPHPGDADLSHFHG